MHPKIMRPALLAGLLLAAAPAFASTYVFAVPPRQSRAKMKVIYGPIAAYLSRVTGDNVHLRYESNWLSYENDMRKGRFDLVFDGPSFISWRMEHQHFVPLAKLKGDLVFKIILRKNDTAISKVSQLAGHMICAFAPPNLATLSVYSLFPDALSQPTIIPVKGLKTPYLSLLKGKCRAAVIQAVLYKKLNAGPTHGKTRVLYTTRPIPNQGFSAGPRIPPAVQAKIREALLSPAGAAATALMRKEFGNRPLVPAHRAEYTGVSSLLNGVWGFSSASGT
ncbi:MAG: phosphate/phosphite/phosphonate ABC transporter substrate-binding protein [Acidiferrobacteraceae bacterium]